MARFRRGPAGSTNYIGLSAAYTYLFMVDGLLLFLPYESSVMNLPMEVPYQREER